MIVRSRKTVAIPPGETIKEQLEDRRMTQKELAARMDMTEKHICKLLSGDVQLTPDVAMRLEMVLGVPASFWNNLEAGYREDLERVKAENEMDADLEEIKKFPYSVIAKLGWVPKATRPEDKVFNLRKFFEVIRLGLLFTVPGIAPGIAYRRQNVTEKSTYASMVWAQKAKLEARNIQVESINLKKLNSYIPQIRKITHLAIKEAQKQLTELLKSCGIAFVVLPHIEGAFLHGAAFYDRNKIVLGLTFRGKDADRFWFSFFHELAHILLGHVNRDANENDEKEANEFAKQTLIPKDDFEQFVAERLFNKKRVLDFAGKIGIPPGIVVGRLQKENYIHFNQLNGLKTQIV